MGALYATVTVDWEGMQIDNKDLNSLVFFKSQYPEIPLTHFICPAYFTRGEQLSQEIQKIHTVTRDDEIGLHIHCWESLISKSDVTPIFQPTCHPHAPTVTYEDQKSDAGFTVPLGAYSASHIKKIVRASKRILAETDLTTTERCVSFRCGAWLASDAVLSAIRNEGLINDASAAPASWLATTTERVLPIFAVWMRSLWGNREIREPAYLANTLIHHSYPEGIQSYLTPNEKSVSMPQILADGLLEVPDTGALMDYTPPAALYHYIQRAWNASQHQNTYISIGFHLESANVTTEFSLKMPLLLALMQVLSKAKQDGITMTYLTINQIRETL